MPGAQTDGSLSVGETLQDLGHGRVQVSYLRGKIRTVFIPQAAEYKHPDQVHLSNCPSPILLTKPRMLLNPADKGFEQVGKEK